MSRGRPKKKPNVDTKTEIAEMVSQTCQLLIEPFDDRIPRSDDLPSMNSVAEEMGVTIIKLKRLLITGNYYTSSTSRAVQERVKHGMSMEQICKELNIAPASFYANIPYSKGAYSQNVVTRMLSAGRTREEIIASAEKAVQEKRKNWKIISARLDFMISEMPDHIIVLPYRDTSSTTVDTVAASEL